MFKSLLLIFALVVASVGAKSDDSVVVDVKCTVKLNKQDYGFVTSEQKTIYKSLKVKKSIFNNDIETIKFEQDIFFGQDHIVNLSYRVRSDLEQLTTEVDIEATLLRDRVGNGKVVLGEYELKTEDSGHLNNSVIDLEVLNSKDFLRVRNIGFIGRTKINSFEQAVYYGYLDKGVVKNALIKCETL